jgi:hypothetical protein
MADQKNNVLADKLSGLKLDYEDYGQLPLRLDVQALTAPEGKKTDAILAQFDKLIYIQKHLKKIDEYIKLKTREPINEWNANSGKVLSTGVLSKLKGHNNETGGISAYFHDLQSIYDQEESIYDKMESQCKITDGTKQMFDDLRNGREDKRRTRGSERKILVKDLKKDGKGFLFVEVEDAPVNTEKEKDVVLSATGEKEEATNKVAEDIKEEADKIKKTTKNVGIYIAGFIVTLTLVIAVVSASGDKK